LCILDFDMKKITELLEILFSTAKQRIKSPFFGSFIFSWLIFNWKPIFYFLFSDEKISMKIEKIENSFEFIQNSLLYPLFLSFIYVLVFPYINQFIHWLTIKAENSKREEYHRLKIEQIRNSQILAEEEKNLEDIRSGNRDVSQLNERINLLIKDNERLKETIQNKNKTISDFGEQLDKVINEKQHYAIELSKFNQELSKQSYVSKINLDFLTFKKSEYFIYFTDIFKSIFDNKDLTNFNKEVVDYYFKNKILEIDEQGRYQLTKKGRNFWDLNVNKYDY
jgi:hypothetical protein